MKRLELTPLRIAVHLAGWFPLAWIVWDWQTGGLSINPIQDVTQRLGRYAIYLLLAALAVTPVRTLTGWHELAKRRRALGLYAFFYATLHFLTFAGLDYAFDINEIGLQILEKPFILLGFTGLGLLVPLAITSFRWFMKKMGKNWKRLHRLVYPAGVIVVLHFGLARKGSLTGLSGDILLPLALGVLLSVLLALRLPPLRRWASGLRYRVRHRKEILE
jgi:methionine sulfoxide reductase heme-binding subunit